MNMTKVSLQNCNMTNELKSFEDFLYMNTLMDKQTYSDILKLTCSLHILARLAQSVVFRNLTTSFTDHFRGLLVRCRVSTFTFFSGDGTCIGF